MRSADVKVAWRLVWAGSTAILLAACGSSTPSPSPTPSPGDTARITIANNAVSPRNITVPRGSQVTFVNNDSRTHQMFSNPHPEHTDCPEINDVGFLNPGQSRLTGNLNTVRTCGYHDHELNTVLSLQGTITIQ
jgi:plastocyanin